MSHTGNVGPLLDPEQAADLERRDREHPTAGGEPECPVCSTRMLRHVERPAAPREDESPFRVRLICPADDCGSWTIYNW